MNAVEVSKLACKNRFRVCIDNGRTQWHEFKTSSTSELSSHFVRIPTRRIEEIGYYIEQLDRKDSIHGMSAESAGVSIMILSHLTGL